MGKRIDYPRDIKMVYLRPYFFLFFFENAKHVGRSNDAKRRKKSDGLTKSSLKFVISKSKDWFYSPAGIVDLGFFLPWALLWFSALCSSLA